METTEDFNARGIAIALRTQIMNGYFPIIGVALLLAFSLVLFSQCSDSIDCARASDNIITEERDIRDFRGVIFNSIGDIKVAQGPEFSFKIQGPDNVVETSTTEIERDMLVIGNSRCFNGNARVRIDITAPEFVYLGLVGQGSIESDGAIQGERLVVEFAGLGNVSIEVNVDTLHTSIRSRGTIDYRGNSTIHTVLSSGQMTLNAFDMPTQHTSINITGQGDSYVRVSETLEVKITGTGKVYYRGNPTVQSNITGVGEVINDN